MSNHLRVLGLKTNPILQLIVSRPRIADECRGMEDFREVNEHHITLARLDDLGMSLEHVRFTPQPQIEVSLKNQVYKVEGNSKTSLYVPLAPWSQADLQDYVKEISGAAYLNLFDPERIFHVTIANKGGGNVRSSVGDVWKYPSTRVL